MTVEFSRVKYLPIDHCTFQLVIVSAGSNDLCLHSCSGSLAQFEAELIFSSNCWMDVIDESREDKQYL